MKKIGFILSIILIFSIGIYPYIYFVVDWPFGLLTTKPDDLLRDPLWKLGFILHIVPGSIALLTGWSQFIKSFRNRKINWHRFFGKIYVIAALLSGLGGLYSGFFASGGWVAQIGFISLAVVWLSTTSKAYLTIRHGNIDSHEKFMIYSYAACLAAVTLRIWMPLLMGLTGDFQIAYPIVAWLCWVPNMIVARKLTL